MPVLHSSQKNISTARILHDACPKKFFFSRIWGEGQLPHFPVSYAYVYVGCMQAEMYVSDSAVESLSRFCRWQSRLAGVDHDYAILLTGRDICATGGDTPCRTLGTRRPLNVIVQLGVACMVAQR